MKQEKKNNFNILDTGITWKKGRKQSREKTILVFSFKIKLVFIRNILANTSTFSLYGIQPIQYSFTIKQKHIRHIFFFRNMVLLLDLCWAVEFKVVNLWVHPTFTVVFLLRISFDLCLFHSNFIFAFFQSANRQKYEFQLFSCKFSWGYLEYLFYAFSLKTFFYSYATAPNIPNYKNDRSTK